MSQETIHIALSFDEGYAEQATVMLYSVLKNNPFNNITAHIFFNDLKETSQHRITGDLSVFKNFNIQWIKVDGALIKGFIRRSGHVNEYTYTRIFMARLLPLVDRVLYLDCDLLVLSDLLELWHTNLNDKLLGAVEDPSPFGRHSELSMPAGAKYFNAGVLLINARQWRELNTTAVVVRRLDELGNKADWWDQDGLNSALYNSWFPLSPKWNVQSHNIMLAQFAKVKNIKAALTPAIVHFTGNLKPWNYKSSNPYKKEYYQYLSQTSFAKTHKPVNKTPLNVVRRSVRNVLVALHIIKF